MIQIDLFCYRMPLHPLDERFDRRVADLTHRLPDRGEGRRDDLGDHDVIKTDKRDILRHADTGVGQRPPQWCPTYRRSRPVAPADATAPASR